jgi:hypothetical protein
MFFLFWNCNDIDGPTRKGPYAIRSLSTFPPFWLPVSCQLCLPDRLLSLANPPLHLPVCLLFQWLTTCLLDLCLSVCPTICLDLHGYLSACWLCTCLHTWPTVYWPIFSVYLMSCLSFYLMTCLFVYAMASLTVYVIVCLSVNVMVCLYMSMKLLACLTVSVMVCLSVYAMACMPVYVKDCLSIYIVVCMSVYFDARLSVCLSSGLSLSVSVTACISVYRGVSEGQYTCIYLFIYTVLSLNRLRGNFAFRWKKILSFFYECPIFPFLAKKAV